MSLRLIVAAFMAFALVACSANKPVEQQPDGPGVSNAAATEAGADATEFSLSGAPGMPIASPEAATTEPARSGFEAVLTESDAEQQYVILNFDNADIQTIISTFGELLNMNYILTPGVSGSITIQSYSRVPVKDLCTIFQSVLEINGLTAVRSGEYYVIMPIDMAKTRPMDVNVGREAPVSLDSSFVTQLVPLRNVKASEISNLLRNLMPRGTSLIIYEPANLLIVSALPHTIKTFLRVIEALDVSDADTESIKTFVYYVEHGEAKKLEAILKTLFKDQETAGGASVAAQVAAATPTTPTRPTRRTAVAPATVAAEGLPGEIGEITISAYEEINALIVKCTPRSYLALLEVLKKIDVPPKQVLIEVMIAEVTLGENMEFGLEWMFKRNSGNIAGFNSSRFLNSENGTILSPSNVALGAEAGKLNIIGSSTMGTTDFIHMFTAMEGQSDFNVLATPHILAMDNREAEIKIGSEVPTATSTTQSTEGVTSTSQIQYRTVGTILTVTPHITEKGNVSLKIVVESSDVGGLTRIGSGDYPAFITRKATTNAVVRDGHTLFLGGLISEKRNVTQSGIPFLSRIPIIGALFGSWGRTHDKTEMFVMVTPRVINNDAEADQASQRFLERIRVIKENLDQMEE
jgi:general secretion pathway protein D